MWTSLKDEEEGMHGGDTGQEALANRDSLALQPQDRESIKPLSDDASVNTSRTASIVSTPHRGTLTDEEEGMAGLVGTDEDEEASGEEAGSDKEPEIHVEAPTEEKDGESVQSDVFSMLHAVPSQSSQSVATEDFSNAAPVVNAESFATRASQATLRAGNTSSARRPNDEESHTATSQFTSATQITQPRANRGGVNPRTVPPVSSNEDDLYGNDSFFEELETDSSEDSSADSAEMTRSHLQMS
jgi:hypothetical protein